MSRIEARAVRKGSGARIALWSVALGIATVLPLALYIAFGPRDGNPIGLGLLAVVGVPAAGVGIFAGVVKMLVERFARSGE
jgi:hypothetical protein